MYTEAILIIMAATIYTDSQIFWSAYIKYYATLTSNNSRNRHDCRNIRQKSKTKPTLSEALHSAKYPTEKCETNTENLQKAQGNVRGQNSASAAATLQQQAVHTI